MNDLLIQLLLALKLLTGYDVSVPEVIVLPPAQLATMACKTGCANVKSYYRHGVLYVSDQLDLTTPLARSALYHELVHHGQAARRGEAKDCDEWTRREHEAYAAQNKYLSEVEQVGTRVYFSGSCREAA